MPASDLTDPQENALHHPAVEEAGGVGAGQGLTTTGTAAWTMRWMESEGVSKVPVSSGASPGAPHVTGSALTDRPVRGAGLTEGTGAQPGRRI
jgi:hypothetical protein